MEEVTLVWIQIFTQAPLLELSMILSMTLILATPSAIGVGTGVSFFIDSENKSPCMVY